MQAGGTPLLAPSTSEGVAVHVSRLTMEPPAPTGEAGPCAASKDQSAGEAVDPITTAPSISIPIPTRESPPVALELQRADSPPHVSIASLPKHCKFRCPEEAQQQSWVGIRSVVGHDLQSEGLVGSTQQKSLRTNYVVSWSIRVQPARFCLCCKNLRVSTAAAAGVFVLAFFATVLHASKLCCFCFLLLFGFTHFFPADSTT